MTLRTGPGLLSVCVFFALGGCLRSAPSSQRDRAWPEQLAGRQLQVAKDHYVLYATDAKRAAKLSRWVDRELATFRDHYGSMCHRQGIILAIEPDTEPAPPVEKWQRAHINRSRSIEWFWPHPSMALSDSFVTGDGRPYCWGREPYFRESFSMPYAEALRLELLDESAGEPGWICFLTTDEHVYAAFDLRSKEATQRFLKEDAHAVDDAVEFLMARVFVIQYRYLDAELARLQREETLWSGLIAHSIKDEGVRTEAIANLGNELDRLWADVWLNRPRD